MSVVFFFFFKQKTAYEMRISDWSSDVCSSDLPMNERQRKVVNRLLDGFEGKLTNAKWAAITKASSDTALRDINDLLRRGILEKEPAGGRSTSYSLVLPES